MGSVRVVLLEPQGSATWKVGSVHSFRVGLGCIGVPAGIAEIEFDPKIFTLIDSSQQVPLNAGTYERTITWELKALVPAEAVTVPVLVSTGPAASAIITVIK